MKETEILRGLDKARAKRSAQVQKFANGVASAQPAQPPLLSIRGLGNAAARGYGGLVSGTTDLMERTLGGVRQVPPMPIAMPPAAPSTAPAPAPVAAPTEPAAPNNVGDALRTYSDPNATTNRLQTLEQKYGFADGVAEVNPMSLRGLGRTIRRGYDSAVEGTTNLMEAVVPIRNAAQRYEARIANTPAPAPAMPAPVAPAPVVPGGPANITTYSSGMQGVNAAREAAAGLRRGVAKLEGPGTETSDDIPAMLSKGEAVLPAKTVKAVGPKNIARLIEATNGKPPVDGAEHGLRAADGYVPGKKAFGAMVDEIAPRGTTPYSTGITHAADDLTKNPAKPFANPAPNPVTPDMPEYHGSGRYGAPANPAMPEPAAPTKPQSALDKGLQRGKDAINALRGKPVGAPPSAPATPKGPGMLRAGASLAARTATPLAGALAAADTYRTDTEEFRRRFGNETDSPTVVGDLWNRTLGAAQTFGNTVTGGLADRLANRIFNGSWDNSSGYQTPAPTPTATAPAAAPTATAPAAAPTQPQGLRPPPERMTVDAPAPKEMQDNVIYRDGNSFSGKNIKAGAFDANPGLGGTAEGRERDARALAMYQDMNRQAAAEGDAARASANATNDALQADFEQQSAMRDIRSAITDARTQANRLSGRERAEALIKVGEMERQAALAPQAMALERQKAGMGNADARARMMQAWAMHRENVDQRVADRELAAFNAAEARDVRRDAQAATAATARSAAERKNYEESAKDFANLFDGTDKDGKPIRNERAEALATLVAERNSGGRYRTMSPAERAKHREDAIETVKFIEAARSGQNNSWFQALGLTNPDAALDYLPQLKGRKLEKAGVWEGATTPNASIGDYVIRMPGGKDMYLPHGQLSEGTLNFLKRQGVQIGG